jgi:hypothetical protein
MSKCAAKGREKEEKKEVLLRRWMLFVELASLGGQLRQWSRISHGSCIFLPVDGRVSRELECDLLNRLRCKAVPTNSMAVTRSSPAGTDQLSPHCRRCHALCRDYFRTIIVVLQILLLSKYYWLPSVVV